MLTTILSTLAALASIIASVIGWKLRAERLANDQAKANAATAEKYRNEAKIYAAPARSLDGIIERMRDLDAD